MQIFLSNFRAHFTLMNAESTKIKIGNSCLTYNHNLENVILLECLIFLFFPRRGSRKNADSKNGVNTKCAPTWNMMLFQLVGIFQGSGSFPLKMGNSRKSRKSLGHYSQQYRFICIRRHNQKGKVKDNVELGKVQQEHDGREYGSNANLWEIFVAFMQ